VDSGTGSVEGVNEVVERCAEWLRTDGWSIDRHRVDGPSGPFGTLAVAEQNGGAPGTTVLIGHTDTVFPDGTAAARPLKVDGDRILGPGVCDMKGGLVSGILAVEALRATGTAFGRVIFVLNPDEEVGSPASRPFIMERAADADAVFVLEAARESGAVVTARKGITNARMEFAGRAAHSGVEP
jgi:glutamate carboxypeptidase